MSTASPDHSAPDRATPDHLAADQAAAGRPAADRFAGLRGRGPISPSQLARRNPSIKLLVVIIIALALTFIFDPITPAVLFVIVFLAGLLLGRLSARALLLPLWVFVIAGVAILLANILFNKENAVSAALITLGPVKITGPALWAAGTLWVRLLCFALLSVVFVKTTEPQRFILSLVHQLRLNYRVAYGTMVGYRMLPVFQADYQTIRAAQRVRGVRERAGFLHVWSRMRRYSIPLLAGAVRKAGRVAVAMDARAFGALPDRTYRERMVVRSSDWLFLAIAMAVTAVVIVGLWSAGVTRFTIG
jgi:energy-coupling factor transport system permease protein